MIEKFKRQRRMVLYNYIVWTSCILMILCVFVVAFLLDSVGWEWLAATGLILLGTICTAVLHYRSYGKIPRIIYVISPCRNITEEEKELVVKYIVDLEVDAALSEEYRTVVHSYLDVYQDDPTGELICREHKRWMKMADEVHVFWSKTSTGSHFDFGMAYALDKKIILVEAFTEDTEGKSFLKVIKGEHEKWQKKTNDTVSD